MKIESHSSSFATGSLSAQRVTKIIIPERFPSLNQIIAAAKQTGRGYLYKTLKKKYTDLVADNIKVTDAMPFKSVYLVIRWYEKTKRRDPDNVAAAIKFILDGMCKKGVITDDNSKVVTGWNNKFIYGEEDKVEVTVYGL